MFPSALVTFILSLACSIDAARATGDGEARGIRFVKRNSLTTKDGQFDHTRAARQIAKDIKYVLILDPGLIHGCELFCCSKYRNNLINVERNLGRGALNPVRPPPGP